MLAGDVEQILRKEGVKQRIARAIATASLNVYLAELNGDSILIPPRPSLTNKAISLLVNDFAQVVRAAEIMHVTFFLDNFYYLVRATRPIDRPELAQKLRDLTIDGPFVSVRKSLYNWVAVMHTKTAPVFNDAWRQFDMHLIAPLDRGAATSVELRAFPLSQGRAMLETYLSFQRPSNSPDKIYPYTLEALDTIVRIASEQGRAAGGTCEPRSLLQAAYEVTCRALLDGTRVPIGAEFIEHVLMGKPLLEAVSSLDDEAEITPSERPLLLSVACPCPCHQDEDSATYDTIALYTEAGESDEQRTVGYRCAACNMPVTVPA